MQMGTLVSALGCWFSVWADLPTGAAIVCTFGAALLLMFLAHLVIAKVWPNAVVNS